MKPLFYSGNKRYSQGFTLIELLMVLTIIALILALIIPQYGSLMARVHITQAGEQLISVLEEAKIKSKTGFMSTNTEGSSLVGVRLTKGSNTFSLVSYPLASSQAVAQQATLLSAFQMNDVFIQTITVSKPGQLDTPIDDSLILFSPPFAQSTILDMMHSKDSYQTIMIEIGIGINPQTVLKKKITFFASTNTINYEP